MIKYAKTLKKLLPNSVYNYLRNAYEKYQLKKLYRNDMKLFQGNSYLLSDNKSYKNLRAEITFYYHSLEKGLSNSSLRYNFGKRAYTNLFLAMDKFIELGFDVNDERFQQAIEVIEQYVNIHEKNDVDAGVVKEKYNSYKKLKNDIQYNGGYTEYTKNSIPIYSELPYNKIISERHSIRDFGKDIIPVSSINNAIKVSMKAPSACNRHPWKVYNITNKEKLQEVYKLQGGLLTNGENIRGLLLITTSNSYYNGGHERNQAFIDGGMFAVTLLYSLTENQVATCPLHADFSLEKERNIRRILNLEDDEKLICFIAYGSYPEKGKYANSPRDNYKNILVNFS